MPNGPFTLSHVLLDELKSIKGSQMRATLDPEASEQSKLRQIYNAAYNCRLSALCLSGGGIRSASFSLGIIQALADAGLLQRFDYLSTVSGGGYIGAWLSARLYHTRDANNVVDAKKVVAELRSRRVDSDSEAQPIKHLREYSSYLTPKVGLLSADTWTALAIILRNTLLNWLILVPLICLPVIAVKIIAALVHTGRFGYAQWWSAVAAVVCCLLLALSIRYQLYRLYASRDIYDAAKEQKCFLWFSVFPATIAGGGVAWLANQQLEHQGLTLADALLAPTNASSIWHEWQVMAALGFSFCGIIALAASAHILLGKPLLHSFRRCEKDAFWKISAWISLLGGLMMWVGVLLASTNASSIWHEWQMIAALGFLLYGLPALAALAHVRLSKLHLVLFCLRAKDTLKKISVWIISASIVIGLLWGLVMGGGVLLASTNASSIWHKWQMMPALGCLLYGPPALAALAHALRSKPQRNSPGLRVEEAGWIILTWTVIGLLWGLVMRVGALLAPTNAPTLWHGWRSMAALGFLLYGLTALVSSALALLSKLQPKQDSPGLCVKDASRNILAWAVTGLLWGSVMWVGVRLYWMIGPLAFDRQVLLVVFGLPWMLLAMRVGQLVYVGGRSYSQFSDFEREWLGRAAGWFLIVALAWIVLSSLVFLGTALYQYSTVVRSELPKWVAGISGASGALTALLGMSSFSPGRGRARDWKGVAANVGLAVAGPLFAGTLLILLSMLFDWVVIGSPYSQSAMFTGGQVDKDYCSEWIWTGGVTIALIIIMVAANLFINVNRFSLHALYRNRLIRAFLGGARDPLPDGEHDPLLDGAHDPYRRPDGFTGFDQYDNLRVGELWPPDRGPDQGQKSWRPFHVINMTLNLASPKRLAWQQRKGISFTVTPKFCGAAGDGFGYRPTKEYGDLEGGISLGTAMAISGAAVSPNMGYHSSPSIAFLLTFFNVRLGWWLGNPGAAAYQKDAPRFALGPLLSELFGLTTEDSRFVYLSDGGHFENFGLYEMVRRRCRWIIVCDGAQDRDRKYEDLGNAVRKIWIDLGVRVSFEDSPLLRATEGTAPSDLPYFALGTIEYVSDGSDGDTPHCGHILYIKPAVRGDEAAADVIAYQRLNPAFPQQSTGDQWFDEPQLEAYRALGYLIMTKVVKAVTIWGNAPNDLDKLFSRLKRVEPIALGPKSVPNYDEAWGPVL